MNAPTALTAADVASLKASLHTDLHSEQWYTVLAAAAAAARVGHSAIPLIWRQAKQELVDSKQDEDEANAAAVTIQRRIKETLLKGSVIFGIAACLESLFHLLHLLRDDASKHPARSDDDFFLRRGRAHEDKLPAFAEDGLRRVYRHNLDEIKQQRFKRDNLDIQFLTMELNYGWNLSEYGILDFPSTELIILATLLVTPGVATETRWHLRGCRRAGWSDEVIESVRQTCFALVRMCRERQIGMYGWDEDKVPSLADVKEDSNE